MHDYTSIRNREMPLKVGGNASFALGGSVDGRVSAVAATLGSPSWLKWVYFPNSKTLRNQYTAIAGLGFPMCLSACTV
jgi:hypothetical protein